jgi:hypothetical protein
LQSHVAVSASRSAISGARSATRMKNARMKRPAIPIVLRR